MSIFLPYSVNEVINAFTTWFNVDLSTLNNYQNLVLTIGANLYFIVFWWFIIWCILKGLNWVYERIF